tara:strand:- start:119 stop:730 length:612 start_codon:yes stop_codon:yes gene_type:complete
MARMQFTPALLLELIAANWPRAQKLGGWARQLVKDPAADTIARNVHSEVLRILRPAESMVRRMQLILALKEPIALVPPANAGASAHPSPKANSPVLPAQAGTKAGAASQAQFLLTEPLTIRLPSDATPFVKFGPRIFVFGSDMDWRPLPREAPPPPLPTAPLLARLSRFDAVLAEPDAHAVRLARLIARLRGARAAPAARWTG